MAVQPSRRQFLARAAAATITAGILPRLAQAQADDEGMATQVIAEAERLAGIQFEEAERELMAKSVAEHVANLAAIRDLQIPNHIPPAMGFFPLGRPEESSVPVPPMWPDYDAKLAGFTDGAAGSALRHGGENPLEQLAFAPIAHLGDLLRRGKISSRELTQMYLKRLRRLNESLECVISFTDERALEQAARADEELASGRDRGPLHGIPWGAKDILAVKDTPTTWGARPYHTQVLDEDAEVVRRLDAAGAVLIAKTTVGALAWGDVWFGGTTKNPWNLEQGSSGSSAGSASAVAAGGLPFAIGTETLGSIVSPCSRCGSTGIRPTFGRVPRSGCMALSWSMDKIGPIARSVEDAAAVLLAIHGADNQDLDAITAPLRLHDPRALGALRFGYEQAAFESEYPQSEIDGESLKIIRGLGVELTPVTLPDLPAADMLVILEAEAAAAFDELTRSNRDEELVRQVEQAWPNVFRAAQLIPAVQYIQAQRARTILMREFEESLHAVDGYVAPSFAGQTLVMTNLTGHPTVVLPNGFREDGTPTSLSFVGRNYAEGPIIALAAAYQRASGWHRKHPGM